MLTSRAPQATPRSSRRRPAVAGVAVELDQLHRLVIALLRAVKVEDESARVGPALLSALSVLTFGGPQSLGALARAEGVRPPTMSRLVDGLERDGLARRRVDPDDARGLRIAVTARGRALLLAADPLPPLKDLYVQRAQDLVGGKIDTKAYEARLAEQFPDGAVAKGKLFNAVAQESLQGENMLLVLRGLREESVTVDPEGAVFRVLKHAPAKVFPNETAVFPQEGAGS